MGKFEKILFGGAIFLNYMFFGLLNVALLLGLPNSMISGGTRLLIFAIPVFLIVLDYQHRQLGRITAPIWAFIGFFLYYAVVFLLEPASNFLMGVDYIAISGGKSYFAYQLFLVGGGTFLLFFCGKDRFRFLMSHPSLVYVPAMLATLLILWVNRGALSSLALGAANNDFVNRSIVKASMGALFAVSLYYILFGKNLYARVVLGVVGVGISGINLVISDSKSSLVSFFLIAILYFILALRRWSSAILAIVLYALAGTFIFPLVFMSKAWERLVALEGFKEMYMTGDAELARWDMIVSGWNRFLSSPFIGDGIYGGSGESSTHFLPLEILVPTGIIGGILFLIALFGMLRGAAFLVRRFPESYWLLGLVVWEFSQQLMHGYTTSLFCLSTGLLLCADSLRSFPLMAFTPQKGFPAGRLPPHAFRGARPPSLPISPQATVCARERL